jgi:hypothetical protein
LIDHQSFHDTIVGIDPQPIPLGINRHLPYADLDAKHGVASGCQRIDTGTRLRVAVNGNRAGNDRQDGERRDRLHSAAGNVEIDRIRTGGGISVKYRLPQAARSAVVRVGDNKRGSVKTAAQQKS